MQQFFLPHELPNSIVSFIVWLNSKGIVFLCLEFFISTFVLCKSVCVYARFLCTLYCGIGLAATLSILGSPAAILERTGDHSFLGTTKIKLVNYAFKKH